MRKIKYVGSALINWVFTFHIIFLKDEHGVHTCSENQLNVSIPCKRAATYVGEADLILLLRLLF